MKATRVQPVRMPITGEIVEQVEVFDPRVLPWRPGIAAVEAADNRPAQPAVPEYPGTVSLQVRLYDGIGNQVGQPFRNDKTELTPEQYAAWNSQQDDTAHFTDCVITNLGLTKV